MQTGKVITSNTFLYLVSDGKFFFCQNIASFFIRSPL
ncbi:hypothetical protein BMETH_682_0 [methanotrophic bacterial endosymbiont of Bathymodiolus sp.]|nr:hypothetical protein BMETH_682_0 [methanotrophic bacterial endosymbiont of Bathymodiolus sp.]